MAFLVSRDDRAFPALMRRFCRHGPFIAVVTAIYLLPSGSPLPCPSALVLKTPIQRAENHFLAAVILAIVGCDRSSEAFRC